MSPDPLQLPRKAKLKLTDRIANPIDLTQHFPFMVAVVTNLLQLSKDATIRSISNLEPREFRVLLNVGSYMPIKSADIAYLGRLDSYTVSRAVKTLLSSGLIEVVESSKNRKIKNLILTAEGESLYKKLSQSLSTRTSKLESVLNNDEKKELLRMLSLIERKAESMIATHAIEAREQGKSISTDQKEIVRWYKKSLKASGRVS